LEDCGVQKGESYNEAEEGVSSLYQCCVSVDTAMGYRLDGRGSVPSRIRGLFLYYTASKLALGHIQWISGVLSPGVKHLGCEADLSTPPSAGSEMVKLYFHSYTRLHGVVHLAMKTRE
jgi:hypothetical protein